jgi:hypothetical protein
MSIYRFTYRLLAMFKWLRQTSEPLKKSPSTAIGTHFQLKDVPPVWRGQNVLF